MNGCAHASTDIRRLVVAGGAVQLVRQCLDCGWRVGGAISRAKVAEELGGRALVDFDHELEVQANARRQAQRDAEWDAKRAEYRQYLQTDEWARLRRAVLIRARGVCEGCGDARPSDVHHLTYRHIYNEFLFELVALCRDCHERWHADSFMGDA